MSFILPKFEIILSIYRRNYEIQFFMIFRCIETQRRPRFSRGSHQVWYYVSHEVSASLKLQHKDSVTNLWSLFTGGCHVRHLDFQSRIHRSSYYDHAMFILWNMMDHTMKHDHHSLIILWNMVAMVRFWHDHDHGMTMIIVWSYYDHSMVIMFDQPGRAWKFL